MTVTITQTDTPSRSKQAGPCWIAANGIYASTAPRGLDAQIGDTIEVTGNPDDTETFFCGSPQAVTATITGVRRIEA